MDIFKERLKDLRLEKNLTQLQLSKKINISQATIARWENGTRAPSLEHAAIIASFFGCSTDYLAGLEN